MTWILSHEQTETRTHRKLPQQPTKQRERVRMTIMTDAKKETKNNLSPSEEQQGWF